jgi:hypothetical protein
MFGPIFSEFGWPHPLRKSSELLSCNFTLLPMRSSHPGCAYRAPAAYTSDRPSKLLSLAVAGVA